jgi:16S rRNA (guanine(966)-N(2))-methyltransferase RsmD
MRIISGTLKGRSIDVPRNFKGRPTTDFAREGLFNVLNNRVSWDGLRVLDLFAGTGAFSLECFSRGAQSVLAIDMQPLHVRFINDNFRNFEAFNAHAIKQDVFKWVPTANEKFDLIFADPPYDIPGLTKLPSLILEAEILDSNGLLVVEHGKRTDFSGQTGFLFEKTYSNVTFSFFSLQS